jgi:hypothetical protein
MASTLPSATTIVASKDQVSCELAGEAAILNLKNSQYDGLDPIVAEYDVDAALSTRT